MKRRIKLWVVIGFQLVFAASVVFFASKTEAKHKKQPTSYKIEATKGEFVLPDTLTPTPKLVISNEKSSFELGMTELHADIEIVGNVAITKLDMLFYNNQDRILEGELVFPLCEGQAVSGFAMEIDGKLREAVAIEKKQARIAFEETVRQNIDPALIEMTKGNNFKTRVYPIPAKGTKRIVVTIQQELKNSNGFPFYQLPLRYKSPLKHLVVKVNSFDQRAVPQVRSSCLSDLSFHSLTNSYTASIEKSDFQTKEDFVLSLPISSSEAHSLTQRKGENQYFYIHFEAEKFARKKLNPNSLSLLWDVSASAEAKNVAKECKLIEAYLRKLGNVEVEFITFSSSIHSSKHFSIQQGNCSELIRNIQALKYDGGTQLGSIDLRTLPGEEVLLSTDGISNFGKHDLLNPKEKPVFILNSIPGADFSNLQAICDQSGGEFINLNEISEQAALSKLSTQEMKYLGYTQNTQVRDCFPSRACSIGEQFSMSGKVSGSECTLELLFGFGDEIVTRKQINIKPQGPQTVNLHLDRIWAQKALSELDLDYKENKAQITELGKKFNLLTRNTSFLVLDRVEDYIEHEIVPPQELQAAYFKQINRIKKDKSELQKQHLKQVKEDFKARKSWYTKTFKVQKPKKNTGVNQSNLHTNVEPGSVPQEEMVGFEAPVVLEDHAMSDQQTFSLTTTNGTSTESSMYFNASQGKDKEADISDGASIVLDEWSPNVPYLKELKKVSPEKCYARYLKLKEKYANQPSFFLDVADYFLKLKRRDEALRILSNIAEMELEDHTLLRILAHRLEQINELKAAISIYEDVKELREEEPQSYRDLGLAYARDHRTQEAIETLYHVVENSWDDRFHQIESLVLVELNQIIHRSTEKLDLSNIDKDLIFPMETDIRVVLNWDTDNCDMDLWVTDPNREKCYYSNALTKLGGRMSADITQGYGPEEFLIKKAVRGKYKVQVNYYGSSSQKVIGQTTIYMEIYTNYGKKNQKVEYVTRRLESKSEVLDLANFVF